MQITPPLLVFTDLDGTLIDHDTYQWAPARPALDALMQVKAGVVLASSKTAPEINDLRAAMHLEEWPAIVENGAGVLPAHAPKTPEPDEYHRIRAALDRVPDALRRQFTGFGDLTTTEVAQLTGLPAPAAALAKQRAFSEPGVWQGDGRALAGFKQALTTHGISTRDGGRVLTLSYGRNKSDHMAGIIKRYKPLYTIALGDAPNDVEMLETADFGVVIPNPKGHTLPALKGEAGGTMIRAQHAGPAGWNAAILGLLDRLDLQKD